MGMNKKEWEETKLINENEEARQAAKTLSIRQKRATQLASIADVEMTKREYEQAFMHLLEIWEE